MYTPTPQDIATIQQLAKAIPAPQRLVTRTMQGTQLLELDYDTWNGAPIEPHKTYKVQTLLTANLVKVITNIVEREGIDVVNDLVAQLNSGRPLLTTLGTVMFSRTATR